LLCGRFCLLCGGHRGVLTAGGLLRHHQHGACRLSNDMIRHAAEEEAFHAAVTVCAHHDEVSPVFLGEAHDLAIWTADDDVRGDV
jgi:hypothetical protein